MSHNIQVIFKISLCDTCQETSWSTATVKRASSLSIRPIIFLTNLAKTLDADGPFSYSPTINFWDNFVKLSHQKLGNSYSILVWTSSNLQKSFLLGVCVSITCQCCLNEDKDARLALILSVCYWNLGYFPPLPTS